MTTTSPRDKVTIFIVDDDTSFLRSVSRLLTAVGYSVEAFNCAQDFFARSAPERPGCVVADLQMPGINGLQLQEALRRSANPLPVIFLTGQGDIPSTVSAMRSGAEDFLTKRAPRDELLAAVERALARDSRERSLRQRHQELNQRLAGLSEREKEVLQHVVRGKMNKEIASDLNINLRTVKLHRTNITRKLKVQSVAELTRLTDETGMFTTGSTRRPTTLQPSARDTDIPTEQKHGWGEGI
jgi:two-component system, LuxR family, response regulator FixJ